MLQASSQLVGKPLDSLEYGLGARDPLKIHWCILWSFQGEELGVRLPADPGLDVAENVRGFLREWQEPLSLWPVARGLPREVMQLCEKTLWRWRDNEADWQWWERASGGLLPHAYTLAGYHVFKARAAA